MADNNIESMIVQSILFDKQKWTIEEAKAWLKEHNYHSSKIDETDEYYRFRQRDPEDFEESSFRTIEFGDNIKAVVGKLKAQRNFIENVRWYQTSINTEFDEEQLIVRNISLTSDNPVLEFINGKLAYVILEHSKDAIDLSRLNGASFNDEHDGDQVGTIINARLDEKLKKVIIDVKFSPNNDRAKLLFNDMKDKIRRNVSARMFYKDIEQIGHKDGLPLYKVTKWEIIHGALVKDPADYLVGIDRDLINQSPINKKGGSMDTNQIDVKERTLTDEEVHKLKAELKKELSNENQSAIDRAFAEGGEKALLNVAAIMKYARDFKDKIKGVNLQEVAEDYAFKLKASERQFADFIINKLNEQRPVDSFDIPEKQKQQFSLRNLILSHIDRNVKADFEKEICRAYAEEKKLNPNGYIVPPELLQRTMTVGTAGTTTIGSIVGTVLRPQDYIPLARPNTLAERLGVRLWTGLIGNQAIPVQTGAISGQWLSDEITPASASDMTFGQKTLTPKTYSATTSFSRQALLQSTPDIETLVNDDIQKAVALARDKVIFHGTGSNGQPTGLVNVSGVGLGTIKTSFTYADIVAMETVVDTNNLLEDNCFYVTDPTTKGTLKTTEKSPGYPVYLWDNGQMDGYKAISSNQINSGYLFFGDFSQIIVGQWGGLDIVVDAVSSKAGIVYITIFLTMDVLVRYPQAFSFYKPS